VLAKATGTYRVRVNLWLALYKLTGWLVSLDLAAPTQRLILNHRTASPNALYDVLVLERGRGQSMNDLVDDSGREMPVNLPILNKVTLHTDTNMHITSESTEPRPQENSEKGLKLHNRSGGWSDPAVCLDEVTSHLQQSL